MVSIRRAAGPETLEDVKEQVKRDLLQIATAPTSIVAAALRGVIRVIEVVTFSSSRRRRKEKRLSRAEALANIQRILQENGGQIVEVDGKPVILVGNLEPKALGKGEQPDVQEAESQEVAARDS